MSESRFEKGEKHKIVGSILKEGIPIDWRIEMSVFNRLVAKYPNHVFWRKFALPFKLNSLRWLQGDGKDELNKLYLLFELDLGRKATIVEGSTKVGEDYVPVQKKPLSLKDFLK
jgi:hypothetical protein